ncbi:MAG: ABC transporter permease, partial [Gemmatimonadetes bacterium]|nr:ABC transporter permease [Gemmatimonadota bacterium]
VVGQTIKLNGEHATILGIMRPGFAFPDDKLLWVAQRDERGRTPNRQGGPSFQVMGRLRDGATWDRAKAEMATVAAGLARDYPQTNQGVGVAFRTFVDDDTGPEITAVFGGMQVATLFVLLIACANVANLLLARATVRTREAAVRTAIGASPLRVVLPFFAETLLLAAGGAILGTGIAALGVELFDRATRDVGKPYYMIFALDGPVLAFVVGVTVLTALAAGIAPALQILRTNVSSTLKDESRGSSGVLGGRVSRVLVVAQMALSCALLVGAGLMIKSIVKLRNYHFAFATESVFTARLGLFDTVYPDTLSRRLFWRALDERLRSLPGAAAAALTTNLPGGGSGGNRVAIEGQTYATDQDYPSANSAAITPGFFQTFDVTMLQGRGFTTQDEAGSLPVAIVNQDFAERYFPGVSPLGRRVRPGASASTQGWYTIVGVAPTLVVRGLDPDTDNQAEFYLPVAQRDPRFLSLAVRTAAGDAMAQAPAVRQLVRSLDPDLPIYEVFTMLGSIRNQAWFFNVFGTVFIVFGAAALFMASVGLYGLLAFSVSRRVREMGIRMALGATAGDVIGMVLGQGARQTAVGLTIGLALAFGLSRLVRIIMFDVEPRDPLVFGTIGLVIVGVGLAASWVPARRATTVDPIVALRYE